MARLWPAWLMLAAVVIARTWLAAVVPLTDTTEARFGEMARKMVESADWLVPQPLPRSVSFHSPVMTLVA